MTDSRQDVQAEELRKLIEFATKNTYKAKDIDSKVCQPCCFDYFCVMFDFVEGVQMSYFFVK